jgi:hypothetical protein
MGKQPLPSLGSSGVLLPSESWVNGVGEDEGLVERMAKMYFSLRQYWLKERLVSLGIKFIVLVSN